MKRSFSIERTRNRTRNTVQARRLFLYNYNGNRSGNDHIHYRGMKYVIIRISSSGESIVNALPSALSRDSLVIRAVEIGNNYLKILGGW